MMVLDEKLRASNAGLDRWSWGHHLIWVAAQCEERMHERVRHIGQLLVRQQHLVKPYQNCSKTFDWSYDNDYTND